MNAKIESLQKRGRMPNSVAERKEHQYWLVRRSIPVWPVQEGENSLLSAAADFVYDMMKVPTSGLNPEDFEEVRHVHMRKRRTNRTGNAVVVDEVVIRFASAITRDYVFGYAINLAPYADDNNEPMAGVRVEVPEHLSVQFQDLINYGGKLYRQHGKGFKRHINFDDRSLQMYMNIRLPGSEEWLLVNHELAKENRTTRAERSADFTRSRLTSSVTSGEEEASGGSGQPEVMEVSPTLPTSDTLARFRGKKPDQRSTDWE